MIFTKTAALVRARRFLQRSVPPRARGLAPQSAAGVPTEARSSAMRALRDALANSHATNALI